MTRLFRTAALVLCLVNTAIAAETTEPTKDLRHFEITPVAPPVPAMRYEFLFRDFNDRIAGDAVTLYMDAILFMGPKDSEDWSSALDAYKSRDFERFEKLAGDVESRHSTFDELELAGRRDRCDWEIPYRERGAGTLLVHLSPMRDLGRMLAIRAILQLRHNQVADALRSLRTGYALSYNLSKEPTLVSQLVALSVEFALNDATANLMNRPDAPNLFWALTDLPGRKPSFRIDFDRLGSISYSIARAANVKPGAELSASQWRTTLEALEKTYAPDMKDFHADDVVTKTSPQIMLQAKREYGSAHRLTDEESSKVDPMEIICWYYFEQYKIAYDDMYKLQALAYPQLLSLSARYETKAAEWRKTQPANPFFKWLPTVRKAIVTFARLDRQVAAFTAVEAIRSYAAAHGGQLPAKLDDVTETPIPVNPATGRPFEYHLENGQATLADGNAEMPMKYTIEMKK